MAEHGIDDSTVRPAEVGARISRLKNRDVGPRNFIAGLGEVDAVVKLLFEPYQTRMHMLGAMDFDDLLLRFVELLQHFPSIAERYQERYRWLLVDEFQDTNLVQYRMLKLLTGAHGHISVVGDPDQSIYRFRGAELRNILDFQDDFPDTTIIRLETNYRSTGCILAAAQGVIENNEERMEKALYTEGEYGEKLWCQRLDDGEEEATEVGERVLGLLSGGADPEEIAIFYRAHYLSRALEEAFRHLGIPYKIIGGLSFFERREPAGRPQHGAHPERAAAGHRQDHRGEAPDAGKYARDVAGGGSPRPRRAPGVSRQAAAGPGPAGRAV
jgi:DNA helicase-2/ATP-dependent DNA helicase PcrA